MNTDVGVEPRGSDIHGRVFGEGERFIAIAIDGDISEDAIAFCEWSARKFARVFCGLHFVVAVRDLVLLTGMPEASTVR